MMENAGAAPTDLPQRQLGLVIRSVTWPDVLDLVTSPADGGSPAARIDAQIDAVVRRADAGSGR
jgi:hypothetical protein